MNLCDEVNELTRGKMKVYLTPSYQKYGENNQLCIKMVMYNTERLEVRETKVDTELVALGATALFEMVAVIYKKFEEGLSNAEHISVVTVGAGKGSVQGLLNDLAPSLRDISTGLLIPEKEINDWKIIEETAMIVGKMFAAKFRNEKTKQTRQLQVLPPKGLEL